MSRLIDAWYDFVMDERTTDDDIRELFQKKGDERVAALARLAEKDDE